MLDLAAPLLELAKRFSQNSQILDKNAKPSRVWHSGTDDAEELFPLEDDDSDDVTQYQKIARGYAGRAEEGDVWLGDRTQKGVVSGIFRAICRAALNRFGVCAR